MIALNAELLTSAGLIPDKIFTKSAKELRRWRNKVGKALLVRFSVLLTLHS
jgi:hypothetical protein